tara:strand:+ start:870 stop:1088 length:219 start_codon:yes stop_codon:yes gene_type:complete
MSDRNKELKEIQKILGYFLENIRREMEYARQSNDREQSELYVDSQVIPIPESVYAEICEAIDSDRIYFMGIS